MIPPALIDQLRGAGLRITPQRLAIVSALRRATEHRTAPDLCAEIQVNYPTVNVTTVYRTLTALQDAGLVHVMEGPRGAGYEWAESDSHHHLACTSCGAIEEVSNEPVTAMSAALAKRTGFRLTERHYRFEGTCAACSKQARGDR